MFAAFGIAYSYGAFLEELREDFGAGRALASVFFSLTSLLYFGLGSLSGAASDRWGPRRVLLAGAAAFGLGLVVTANARSLAVALAAYGLGVGIGVACAYVPMVALVGGWFEQRRTLALGVAVAGIGLGTLTVPPATAALIESAGWRDAYLVQGLAGAAVMVVCALIVAPAPAQPAGTGTSVGEASRDRSFRWLYLASLLASVALFVPFVHLPAYATERGVDPVAAAGLIGAIGIASVAGRLVLGALAGGDGLLRVLQGCFAAMALSFCLWAVAGGSYAVMLAFTAVLGVGYGGFVALAPAVIAARFGVANLGAVLGALYTGPGLGSAVGPPLAGALIDEAGYGAAIAGALAIGLLSFAAVMPVRLRR